MPGYNGKKLVSETVTRGPDRARVVITLEVQLDIDTMKSLPRWKRTAIDALRDLAAEHTTPQGILSAIEEQDGVYVLETKTEVMG